MRLEGYAVCIESRRICPGGGQERGFRGLIVYLGKWSWWWVISGGLQAQGDSLYTVKNSLAGSVR